MKRTNFTFEFEQETYGRWIAEIRELPGVLCYGATRQEARAKAEALALRVVADRLEAGEYSEDIAAVEFGQAK